MKLQHSAWFLIWLGLALMLLSGLAAVPAEAVSLPEKVSSPALQTTPAPLPPLENKSIGNDTCLSCHGNPNLSMPLENGQLLSLYVSNDVYAHSVHGSSGYACVQCHTTVGNYPHPTFSAADSRDVSLKLYPLCERCHSNQSLMTQNGVHAIARAAGNRNAAVCTDCHTAHAVKPLTDPVTHQLTPESRVWVPQTCAQCHYAIYQKYSTSVHGSALLGEGNPDVPTCIDCHGVHGIENPTTASFRLKSPEICAKCHTDAKIMDKYGISTQVLNTYVADFHGTTVNIFEKESPDAQTNKAVCYDCHGIHDIKRVDDPVYGLQIKENLLARCQQCHPDASTNFPTAWLSHYIPSREKTPLVYFVNLFYKFFIPGVLGGMAVLVVLDAGTALRKRFWKRKKGSSKELAHQPAAQREKIPEQVLTPTGDPVSSDPPTEIDTQAGVTPMEATQTEFPAPEPESGPMPEERQEEQMTGPVAGEAAPAEREDTLNTPALTENDQPADQQPTEPDRGQPSDQEETHG